jgi:glutamyl-tRNA synthetase
MKEQRVRVRFAPSPTGPLHIGGVRTALYNYLFAKKHGGDFILRIEDTDQNRYVEGAEDYIVEALNWCGIHTDESPARGGKYGPYRQSERKELYKQYADQLIESGHAYYAFDTNEELDAHRKEHEADGKTFIYNWHNRLKLKNSLSLSAEEVRQKIANGEDYVIRFKSPENETVLLQDIIRGEIKIDSNILDDKVLFKSDGMPTYHLANIVDDHLMEITHVIRGEEWLPSLALHKLLYDAFGWQAPQFAHLSLLMKPVGKGKLSKRDGDKMGFPVFPLQWKTAEGEIYSGYREDGYFPEAVVNMLAFLGWNPGTEQEIFSLEELIHAFELEKVQKSGAKFDPEKTKWFQAEYIRRKIGLYDLALNFLPIVEKHTSKTVIRDESKAGDLNKKVFDPSYWRNSKYEVLNLGFVMRVIVAIREKATFVSDFWNLSDFFFLSPKVYDEKAINKQWKPETPQLLRAYVEKLQHWDGKSIDNLTNNFTKEFNIGFGKLAQPLRIVLTGELKGPFIGEIIEILGKSETIKRIESAIEKIGK